MLLDIILLLSCICLSAFFSGAETALFSISRARLLSYRNSDDHIKNIIFKLLTTYQQTLTAIILGNMLVNIGISILSDKLLHYIGGLHSSVRIVLSITISVLVLLIFGEITPKTLALFHAEKISAKIALPVFILRKLLSPLIFVSSKIFSFIMTFLERGKHSQLTPEDFVSYVNTAAAGAFSPKEILLIRSAFKLCDITVGEIMIPSIDLMPVHGSASPEKLYKVIKKTRREFYPLIHNDLNDCEKILYSKSFFLNRDFEAPATAACKSIFPAGFYPVNANLNKVLDAMQANDQQAALVVDEYGATVGLITVKDIHSTITGDSEIVYESPEYVINKLSDNVLVIDGSMPVFMFEELMNLKIPEHYESNTVNGLFAEDSGRFPLLGDELNFSGINLRIEKISRRRVSKIRVTRINGKVN